MRFSSFESSVFESSVKLKILRLSAVFAVIATYCLAIMSTALAADFLPFTDVDENTPYYASIQRIYDEGVITGYEDGTFRPDEKITVAEGITMAVRLFGNANDLPQAWSAWFGKTTWSNDIGLDEYYYRSDYSKPMCYETAAELVMKLNNIPYIGTELWNIPSGGFSDYANSLYVRGYEYGFTDVKGKPVGSRGFTRAEFCSMLEFMLDYDGTYMEKTYEPLVEPGIYGDVDSVAAEKRTLEAEAGLLSIPEFIQERFEQDGWRLQVLGEEDWTDKFSSNTVGVCSASKKTIYIRLHFYDSIPHEFGHYVSYVLRTEADYDISTDEELKTAFVSSRGKDSCSLTDEEFFAEVFSDYCTNPKRLSKNEELYEWMNNAVSKFETLCEE